MSGMGSRYSIVIVASINIFVVRTTFSWEKLMPPTNLQLLLNIITLFWPYKEWASGTRLGTAVLDIGSQPLLLILRTLRQWANKKVWIKTLFQKWLIVNDYYNYCTVTVVPPIKVMGCKWILYIV